MPIKPVTVETQASQLTPEKLTAPQVFRNQETGWPLIQIGFLDFDANHGFTQSLGGGDCHEMNLPLYGLALLLAEADKRLKIKDHSGGKMSLDEFKDLAKANSGYSIDSTKLGIKIISGHNKNGQTSKITLSEGIAEDIDQFIYEICRFPDSFKKFVKFAPIGTSMLKEQFISPDKLLERIQSKDSTVLFEGQLYVDLGQFLDKLSANNDVKEHFRAIFKVDEYQELLKSVQPSADSFDYTIHQQAKSADEKQPITMAQLKKWIQAEAQESSKDMEQKSQLAQELREYIKKLEDIQESSATLTLGKQKNQTILAIQRICHILIDELAKPDSGSVGEILKKISSDADLNKYYMQFIKDETASKIIEKFTTIQFSHRPPNTTL
jgi:hypothetical protein